MTPPQMLHEKIHDEVVERLKKAYGQVKIGDPLDGETREHLLYLNPEKIRRVTDAYEHSLCRCNNDWNA